jgi:ribosomal protein S18 acetylase RimI-like enzyme
MPDQSRAMTEDGRMLNGPLPEFMLQRAVQSLTRAFLFDPLFERVQPVERRRRSGLPAVFSAALRDAAHRGGVLFEPGGTLAWIPVAGLHANLIDLVRRGYVKVPLQLGFSATYRLNAHEDWGHSRICTHSSSDAVYVYCVGVDPDLAGRGVGSALVTNALSYLASRYTQCVLRTDQPKNLRFYEKLGFRCVERATCPDSDVTSWFFAKPLVQPE